MNARHIAALALRGMCAAGILLAVGCGGGGGGGCGTPGSTSDCGPGDICSNIQGDGNQCRQLSETKEGHGITDQSWAVICGGMSHSLLNLAVPLAAV